jgi:serine/threonine protein kinase
VTIEKSESSIFEMIQFSDLVVESSDDFPCFGTRKVVTDPSTQTRYFLWHRDPATFPHSEEAISEEFTRLMSFSHGALVPILGYRYEDDTLEYLTPFYPLLSLGEIADRGGPSIPWTTRLKILYGVGHALLFLHQAGILHLTLTLFCIYFDESGNPRLANYVFTKMAHRGLSGLNPPRDSTFLTPELQQAGLRTPAIDVFGFGMFAFGLILLDSSLGPRAGRCTFAQMWLRGLRGKPPKSISRFFADLFFSCISLEPAERPSMTFVMARLHSLWEFVAPDVDPDAFVCYRNSLVPKIEQRITDSQSIVLAVPVFPKIPGQSRKCRAYAERVCHLQEVLNECRDLDAGFEFVQTHYGKSTERLRCFLRNVLVFAKAQFRAIPWYAELTARVFGLAKTTRIFAKIKPVLLEYIFDPLTNESIFPDKVAPIMLLYWLLYRGVFAAEEITNQIQRIQTEHPTYKRTLCLLFCFFAPEMEAKLPEVYENVIEIFRSHESDISFPPAFRNFFSALETLRQNDWAEFHSMIRDERCFQPIKEAIRRDDVDRLRSLWESGDFNFAGPIDSEVYEPCVLAHDSLSPIAYAALSGSIGTFHFLRMKNCRGSTRDNKYYTMGHFSAVGGSLEIIDYVLKGHGSADGFMQIATKFFKTGKYQQLEHDPDITKPDKFGQILIHVAAAANNVAVALQCLATDPEQVNLRESFGWTPLHSAAKSGSYDVMKLLVGMDNADLNARDCVCFECFGVKLRCTWLPNMPARNA